MGCKNMNRVLIMKKYVDKIIQKSEFDDVAEGNINN